MIKLSFKQASFVMDLEDYEELIRQGYAFCIRMHEGNALPAVHKNGKRLLLRRVLFPEVDGSWVVRHLNGNALDCRRENLDPQYRGKI